ncbi:glutamate--tRNA ligase family protein, partial [Variovorax sp. CT11-76]
MVRIEDADTERCLPGMGERILRQLADCALIPDEEPVWQTARTARYEAALARLRERGLAYPCGCSRKDIDEALARLGRQHERHGERVYPGTCRDGLRGEAPGARGLATQK